MKPSEAPYYDASPWAVRPSAPQVPIEGRAAPGGRSATMLIWGTKPVKTTLATGSFYCPGCNTTTSYRHIRARRHGHVYWIPLFPVGDGLEYVECGNCKATWQPTILDHQSQDPSSSTDMLGAALLASAVAVAAANGRVDLEEVEFICKVVESVTGSTLDPKDVKSAARSAGGSQLHTAQQVLRRVEPALSSEGKEMVVKVAIMVAGIDG